MQDTDREAERVHRELLHQAGPARRAQLAFSLSADVISMARRALAHDGVDSAEAALRFVDAHYGAELGQAVRRHLASRDR
jgi:hypothetical protein